MASDIIPAALSSEGRYPREVMSEPGMKTALSRIAAEISDRHPDTPPALIGIRTRGVPLAERIAKELARDGGAVPSLGTLDITFYRDDLSLVDEQPVVQSSDLDFEIEGENVVLVDDVLFTGRTIRAALDSLLDYGRPATIELAVLVDRGCRELPIQPDYVGLKLETSREEVVEVRVKSVDGDNRVLLTHRDLIQGKQGA